MGMGCNYATPLRIRVKNPPGASGANQYGQDSAEVDEHNLHKNGIKIGNRIIAVATSSVAEDLVLRH
jgi:hypothetical protein